ncbi:DUF5931 domain-containing protein [Pseudonocardia xinjiangensis]|uniref:DUF5931 domain-containing protein n=1 Tax=Pseudonocardia xinjiangensis TaxID=75289 RepID=UPI0028B0551D|nr:DUF5931 domain-containing protein [Pseudonocardia xinjiangensis]
MTTPTAADTEQPLAPLWRGLLVYRVLALMSTSAGVLYSLDSYARPGAAVAVLVVMAVWTVLSSFGYFGALPGLRDRCGPIAVADIGVTVAVMATTPFVQTPAQFLGDAPVMGSIWTPGAVLACALVYGVRGGLAGAATVSLALVAFQAHWRDELHDIQLLFLVGVTIGFASTVLRRAAERLRLAVAAEAALAERERLTRGPRRCPAGARVRAPAGRRAGWPGGGAG